MKKFFILVCLFLCASTTISKAQNRTQPHSTNKQRATIESLITKLDSMMLINNTILDQININTSLKYRYKLYQTENTYTFLQLDTKTGKIEQVQWSLDSDYEGSMEINSTDLSIGEGQGSASFELYPTKNMYQFILLDKTNGRKWHVQWGMDENKRWIRRIF